jgi:hypothetical protein
MCACNIQGWAPDHVFRTGPREGPGDGCTTQEFRVKRGKRWRPVRGPGGGFLAVAPWSRGRKLVLGQDCGLQSALAVLDAADHVVRAADAPSIESLTGPVQAFAAFESGEVLVLSRPRESGGPARLSIWRSGQREPHSHPLPGPDWEAAGMVARSPADVFVGASTAEGPYLAHFDGSTWKRLPLAGPTDIDALRPAKDGGIWLVGSGTRLWHVGAAGGLRSLLLPANFTLLDVLEREPGDLWVVSDRELYRSGPVAAELTIATDCPAAVEKDAANRLVALERCKPRLEPLAR